MAGRASSDALADALARQPRVALATVPTPLQEAPRLRAALGGSALAPRILLKRDDLTGLAGGGNKARKLEFLLADARRQEATWLITTGGVQSNHARMTAAAARIHGFGVSLVLTSPVEQPEVQGNLLLDRLLDADIRLVPPSDDPGAPTSGREAEAIERLVADLRERGERPYVIPLGGSNEVGALGYVAAAVELAAQLELADASPSRIYVAVGSNGTAAGLAAGTRLAGLGAAVHGVAVAGPALTTRDRAEDLAGRTVALLGLPDAPGAAYELDEGQVGAGYGRATAACLEAISLLARTEGVILDPVYTGKAMAGLVADVRARRIDPSETVVFLHTGGLPGLFAQAAVVAGGLAGGGEVSPGG